jgi:Histidine kinase-, DNA gyrase B-, and HSP90-like ATPase
MSSLRGVGYSLETAIADLVDNSIAAGARSIEIGLDWNDGDPAVTILDDGCGMAESTLVEAMRFGGVGPGTERAATDLGRFGLGLKTASLSQCRQLTVASKASGGFAAFTWDVDTIEHGDGRWNLIEGTMRAQSGTLDVLRSRTAGTLVLWRKVDFGRLDDRPDASAFLADAERLDRHLGMVFHRFIQGDAQLITISINGSLVEAWDPFLQSHNATIPQPAQRIKSPGGPVIVRGFVLPHRDRFRNEEEFEGAGGPEGWNAQQGFYVYRQKRLLSGGGWLGLGGSRTWTREEPSRLARIRIDIPNSADRDWRIDIRKAIARPPDAIRKRLQGIADDVRRKAREVFVHRGLYGPRQKEADVSRIWKVDPDGAARRYRINRDHELIRLVKARLGANAELLDSVIDLIERTVPIERVWLDVTERGTPARQTEDDPELTKAAATLVALMKQAGVPLDAAIAKVAAMDPFDQVQGLQGKLSGVRFRGVAP